MSDKNILVVDDDKFILTFLEHTLKKFEPDYRVVTVINGPEALEQIQQRNFDLVITDYMMPGISGIDLANAIRHLNPSTAVVLMTAYATDQLNHTIELLHVDGFIRKPISLAQVRKVVKDTIGRSTQKKSVIPLDQKRLEEDVNKHLQSLYLNAGARYVILVHAGGQPIQVVGPAEKEEAAQVAMVVAANFLAARKIAVSLDSQPHYRSSSFEGNGYDIYAYHVDDDFLLAVVFSKETRPGIVSVYTKQASEALKSLVNEFPSDHFGPTINLDITIDKTVPE